MSRLTCGEAATAQNDYGSEQKDWETEQSDSCSNLADDANTVSDDANTVSDDLNSLNDDVNGLQTGDYQSVQTDLANAQSDLNTLSTLGATPDLPISAAIADGKQALTNAAKAISWANGRGAAINSEAAQLATTAADWADQHGC